MSKTPRNLTDLGGEQRDLAALRRRVAALERLYGDPQDSNHHMAVPRQVRQDGILSSIVACSYDPVAAISSAAAVNNSLRFAGMWVPETRSVNNVFAGLVAGVTLVSGGNFNGTALYKYDWNEGTPQLILLGRTSNAVGHNASGVTSGGFLGSLVACNSSPSTYGLAGVDAFTGLSDDWVIGPGLYYACHGYSDDGTGTRALNILASPSATGSANLFNMTYDQDAYPVPRFAGVTNAASLPPDQLLCSTLNAGAIVPWMALHS